MNIEIKNISKSFNDKEVFKNLSLSINSGERIALVGKSGIGKTTFLRLLMKELVPDSGEIIFSEDVRYSVVFQDNLLFENKTVYENIIFVKDISKEDVKKYLKTLYLEDIIDKKVCELSGGMKRRVAILRAIIYSGNLFIFDEALREVDLKTRDEIVNIINTMVKETLIITTHNLNDIEDLKVDRVIDIGDFKF